MPLRLTLEPAGPCVELVQPHAIVGRHSEADVRLALPDVSRRHCRLVFADGHWKIIDLNSLNGVYVNEERMHEATVYDGDRIRVGSFTFAVKVGAAEQSSADANVLHHIADVLPLPENERRAS